MNFHDIQAFLTIVKYQSISKAAEELYISQTAVTRRLKTLEDELGMTLLDRGRGIKETTLTPSGRDFLSIARRWYAVWEEAQRFKSLGERLSLSIGSVQILNDYIFPPLFAQLLSHSSHLNLQIHTEHSIEFPPLVEQRIIDVAIGWRPSSSPELYCRPWKRTALTFLCHKTALPGRSEPIPTEDLDAGQELYVPWSDEFRHWHDACWPPEHNHPNDVSSARLAMQIMEHNKKSWTIMPQFLAAYAQQHGPFSSFSLQPAPPTITAYILTHRSPRPNVQKSLDIFFQYLDHLDRTL